MKVHMDYEALTNRWRAMSFLTRENGSNFKVENLKYLLFEGDVFSVGGILDYNISLSWYELSAPFVIVGGGIQNLIIYF